ncbi:hypothetical protein PG991_000188 [Apiospora marii]|uniref:5'-3' DNA helicase ZGRF1-like N-terminal domain-containing protein n=1 Tax=Apiospora marii TaxID=335849 RepID=A0ABR1T361_9PEZI
MAAVTQLAPSSAASNSGRGPRSVAPVLEYICLFTHDLKRKQKRWQDGRLKYHTFNKRIMVYDERGNFIGDSHWREDYDFGEGEELQLERGSVMVEVAECVGSTEQDLTELVDKRVQEKAERQSAAAARHAGSRAPSQPGPLHSSPAHAQQGHRPLQNMLGTPSGHYGRAVVPSESPYELKQREQADAKHDGSRPAKRRREDTTPTSSTQGYARNLFGAPLNLSARPMSSAPVRHNPRKVLQTRRDESPPMSSDPKEATAEDEGPKKPERPSASRYLGAIPSVERNAPEPVPAPLMANPRKQKLAEPRNTSSLNASKGKSREDPVAIDSVDRRQGVQGADHPDCEPKIGKRMAVL